MEIRIRVRHVTTELVPTLDGYYSFLQVDWTKDGRTWQSVCTTRQYTPDHEKPDGSALATKLESELKGRLERAGDKIQELKEIRREHAC